MRVLMISKACIVGIYQRKLEAIARCGIDLRVIVPPSWKDERGETLLERTYTQGYDLTVLPLARNGDFHLHWYRGLGEQVRAFQPDVVHIDEEPYNLAAWQAQFEADRVGARTLFFTWQNLLRQYPPPFRWGERYVVDRARACLAGTDSAAEVWRAKGYRGAIHVIPQFGTDAALFAPNFPLSTPVERRSGGKVRPFTVGFFGRLVEEKGVHILLDALAALEGDWRLYVLGSGPQQAALQAQAQRLNIADRVTWRAWIASAEMPAQYHTLDALALPSLTRLNWKEQFGRVLVEAMASGVPVVGSDSGAIADVIGDAGLTTPEGDAPALTAALRRLRDDHALYANLRERGIARVKAHFTHEQIAATTVAVYRKII